MDSMREWGAILAKMAFAILWSDAVILAYVVKKAHLLYIGRPSQKTLREDARVGL
jgi:hypothetical protein